MAGLVLVLLMTIPNLVHGNLLQRRHGGLQIDHLEVKQAIEAAAPKIKYPPEFKFSMPIDHFNDSDDRTYNNRYWLNSTYYRPGGPVFFYDAGMAATRHTLF